MQPGFSRRAKLTERGSGGISDSSHYVRGALMKHNTSGSAASMMHVT
jgi:hypothetical protein